jgi:hypothetical protein
MPGHWKVTATAAFLVLAVAAGGAMTMEGPAATPETSRRERERGWTPVGGTSLVVPTNTEVVYAVRAKVWVADGAASDVACPDFEIVRREATTTVTAYCEATNEVGETPIRLEVAAAVENLDAWLVVESCIDRRAALSDQPLACTVSNPESTT